MRALDEIERQITVATGDKLERPNAQQTVPAVLLEFDLVYLFDVDLSDVPGDEPGSD